MFSMKTGLDVVVVAPVSRCIYCGCALEVQTKPAHVFSEGLGGRLATTTTVCDDCNNSFSNIEGQVCLRLAAIGAFAGARRGDRKYVSTVIESQGSKWRLENGRMDQMAEPPREKGRINPLPARREDQIATIARALKSRGLPAEAMLDGRFALEEESDVPPVEPLQTEPVELGFKWGDRTSKRVMIKIAIELLAYFDPDGARSPELDRARRFARYDDGNEMDFRAGPDIETSGSDLPHVETTWFHGMDVWTSGRRLNYRITLFSHIRWVGTLTENWTDPTISASYTFDVASPGVCMLDRELRDGATLVNKSHRLRERECEEAFALVEKTNFDNAQRIKFRAPKPNFEDLYPDVKASMEKHGKK